MSKTREKLESIESSVDAEAILNATSNSVLQNEKKFGSSLAKVMSALQSLLDEIGVGFEDIRDLNGEEQGWIDAAIKKLEAAKKELAKVELYLIHAKYDDIIVLLKDDDVYPEMWPEKIRERVETQRRLMRRGIPSRKQKEPENIPQETPESPQDTIPV